MRRSMKRTNVRTVHSQDMQPKAYVVFAATAVKETVFLFTRIHGIRKTTYVGSARNPCKATVSFIFTFNHELKAFFYIKIFELTPCHEHLINNILCSKNF